MKKNKRQPFSIQVKPQCYTRFYDIHYLKTVFTFLTHIFKKRKNKKQKLFSENKNIK